MFSEMNKYIAKRLVMMIPIVLGVTFLVFFYHVPASGRPGTYDSGHGSEGRGCGGL